MDRGAADRPPDGQWRTTFCLGQRDLVAAGEGGVFRRTVAVDHLQIWAGHHHARHPCGRHHIAPGQQMGQRGKGFGRLVGHGVKQPCRQPQRGDPLTLQRLPKRAKRQRIFICNHQRAAIQQRAPDFQCGRIKGDGRVL